MALHYRLNLQHAAAMLGETHAEDLVDSEEAVSVANQRYALMFREARHGVKGITEISYYDFCNAMENLPWLKRRSEKFTLKLEVTKKKPFSQDTLNALNRWPEQHVSQLFKIYQRDTSCLTVAYTPYLEVIPARNKTTVISNCGLLVFSEK